MGQGIQHHQTVRETANAFGVQDTKGYCDANTTQHVYTHAHTHTRARARACGHQRMHTSYAHHTLHPRWPDLDHLPQRLHCICHCDQAQSPAPHHRQPAASNEPIKRQITRSTVRSDDCTPRGPSAREYAQVKCVSLNCGLHVRRYGRRGGGNAW